MSDAISSPTTRGWKRHLVELVTITVGVLIALSLEGARQWLSDRALVREAERTLRIEIEGNRAEIERIIADDEERQEALEGALTFVDEILGFDTHADRLPTMQRALDVGIKPGLSVDIETTVPGELFTQMRSVLAVQRMRAALGNPAVGRPQLTARDVLAMATIHGAETIGMEQSCGSLTPGKKADLVMIDQSGPNGFPLNNAYGSVVMGADSSAVRLVMVNGVVKKWGDGLVDVDLPRVRSLVEESRRYLLDRLDYEPDLFIDYPTLDTGPPRYRP